MTAQAVLFDLDGVLLDSGEAIIGSINAALADLGEPPHPPAALRRYVGPTLQDGFAELVGPARAQALVQAYRARYAPVSLARTTVYPGMVEVLDALAPHVPLAVATSKPLAFARPLCDHLSLTGRFAALEGPGLETPEPKEATVRRALAALGLAPGARAPLVGDREHDVVAAHANGLACVGVLWGFGEEGELRAAGADALVRAPAELPAALGLDGSPRRVRPGVAAVP